jgi:hypothetical protein
VEVRERDREIDIEKWRQGDRVGDRERDRKRGSEAGRERGEGERKRGRPRV